MKTAKWNGWSALAELEATYAFVDDYRSNPTGSDATDPYVVGNTVIFDPENFELNRGWVRYEHEDWAFKVGRQRIVRNNQAMVGTVGWRQNEQTFDAVSFTYAKNDFEFSYAYANRAQRIFGNDGDDAPANSPLLNFEGDFHFLDGSMALGGSHRTLGTYPGGTIRLSIGPFLTSFEIDRVPRSPHPIITETSMSASGQSVVLVYSTSHAIRLESLLRAKQTSCKLIPVPRHLSSDCGVCLRFDDDDCDVVDQALEQAGLEVQGIASTSR